MTSHKLPCTKMIAAAQCNQVNNSRWVNYRSMPKLDEELKLLRVTINRAMPSQSQHGTHRRTILLILQRSSRPYSLKELREADRAYGLTRLYTLCVILRGTQGLLGGASWFEREFVNTAPLWRTFKVSIILVYLFVVCCG